MTPAEVAQIAKEAAEAKKRKEEAEGYVEGGIRSKLQAERDEVRKRAEVEAAAWKERVKKAKTEAQARLDAKVKTVQALLPRLKGADAAGRRAALTELQAVGAYKSQLGLSETPESVPKPASTAIYHSHYWLNPYHAYQSCQDEREVFFKFDRSELALADLRRAGLSPSMCCSWGYTMEACREAGYSAAEMSLSFSLIQCIHAGFDWGELIGAGFSASTYEDVINAMKVDELRNALEQVGCDKKGLKSALLKRMLSAVSDRQNAARSSVAAAAPSAPAAALSALDAEVEMQDVHAAVLSEENARLTEQLKEQAEARQAAEARLKSEQAKLLASEKARLEAELVGASAASSSAAAAEVTMRRRANDEASSREAAAAMARADGDALLASADADAVDATAFMARYLAFRQHVELILLYVPSKTARTKPWKLIVRRAHLWRDVITHFSDFSRMKVFQVRESSPVYLRGRPI
jgi:hypothetical protein